MQAGYLLPIFHMGGSLKGTHIGLSAAVGLPSLLVNAEAGRGEAL